jgi:hypothetical protein
MVQIESSAAGKLSPNEVFRCFAKLGVEFSASVAPISISME